jgi:cysteine synthase
MNPGQSVKDRAALFIIRDAEKKGLLKPGGVIVEGTAGNTGIGLTVVGKALGYRTVIVIPDTQSQEKKDALRLLGAELLEVPAVPYRNPNNYVKVSGRLAEKLAQSEAQRRDLGQPVRQCRQSRRPYRDHCRGDLAPDRRQGRRLRLGGRHRRHAGRGVGIGLKAKSNAVKIAIADPLGAALHSYYTTGELKSEGSSITEGIGQGRITANLEGFTPTSPSRCPTRRRCRSSST